MADSVISVECMACHEATAPMEEWSYDIASSCPDGCVDVEITHCGVCGSDVHQLENGWGVATFPLVPGHEIIGTVAQIGGVEGFELGQRVGIGVQRSSCGACDCCEASLEQLCPKITKTYGGPNKEKGGFARYIRYNAKWVFPLPESLSSELAAPLLCAGITTFSPLSRLCKPGMCVGVIGVGGLGHIAIQFAKAMGCTVTAISTGESKRDEAAEFGAARYVVSRDPASLAEAKSTLDVILNTASGQPAMDDYLSLLKPRGVMSCVGLPEKTEKTQLFLHPMVNMEKKVEGSYLGAHADYAKMFAFAAEHGVKPKVEVVPLSEANTAVARCKSGAARYRMVLTMT